MHHGLQCRRCPREVFQIAIQPPAKVFWWLEQPFFLRRFSYELRCDKERPLQINQYTKTRRSPVITPHQLSFRSRASMGSSAINVKTLCSLLVSSVAAPFVLQRRMALGALTPVFIAPVTSFVRRYLTVIRLRLPRVAKSGPA